MQLLYDVAKFDSHCEFRYVDRITSHATSIHVVM